MAFTKALVAAAALSFVQYTQAWNIELPPCIDPFKPYVYSGCYQNSNALEYRSSQSSRNMTVEKCMAECKGNGFRYAGLAYYGNCFCGATVNSPVLLDESECRLPCNGDKSQICGGNNVLSVYQDPTFSADIDQVTIEDYAPLGCYTDGGSNGRSLSWPQDIPQDTFTPGQCLSACRDKGYPFAGLEYGRECWCGSVMANHTLPAPATECNMPCKGDSSQTCGGRSRLNIYVATELESLEPCGHVPELPGTTTVTTLTSSTSTSSSSSSTSTSTTTTSSSSSSTTCTESTSTSSSSSSSSSSISTDSSTSTTSTTATTKTTTVVTTTAVPTTTKFTSTTTTSSALCTTTIVPPVQCEWKCGNWCAPSLPDFEDEENCLGAWKTCAKQVTSCWKHAGFPAALECFKFSQWCGDIKQYCQSDCKGRGKHCSKKTCFDKYTPHHPNPPKPPTTSVFPCPPTTTVTTQTKTTATTVVPEPTNICKQPSSDHYNYGPGNPVGGIELPLVTCNDIKQDFWNNPFKLYTEQDSRRCKSYPRNNCNGACVDACKEQYEECKDIYVESCKPRRGWKRDEEKRDEKLERRTFLGLLQGLLSHFQQKPPANNNNNGGDSPSRATEKCYAQYKDCLAENKYVNAGNRCKNWGHGL